MVGDQSEFLTAEECAEVDRALLTAREKFSARVAIYALRSLKAIAQVETLPIEQLQTHHIVEWVNQDASLKPGSDPSFRAFFAQLVNASRRPLQQAAEAGNCAIADLSVPQVVAWFEAEAKKNLSQKEGFQV